MRTFLILVMTVAILGGLIASCLPESHPLTKADIACIEHDVCP